MKNIIIGILVFVSLQSLNAQNTENIDGLGMGITLTVIIPEQEDNFPSGASNYLKNKLTQAAIHNGIAAGEDFSRFFITADIAMVTQDFVPGPPKQVSQNMELTLYIADLFDQKIFSSTTLPIVGVGTNETKAFISGIKGLNVRSKQMEDFMNKGKVKIIDYYNSQCDNIIKKANSIAFQKQYEEAIYLLTSVPDACTECYDKALSATEHIYQNYIDYLCDINFAKARSAWAAEQNSAGANSAGEFLSQIYPDAKCYGDATDLYNEIRGKVLDDWKFEMKKWQDGVDLESQRIGAMRDVGVAYGNGQQPTTILPAWLTR